MPRVSFENLDLYSCMQVNVTADQENQNKIIVILKKINVTSQKIITIITGYWLLNIDKHTSNPF